jgi:hypothetical protein
MMVRYASDGYTETPDTFMEFYNNGTFLAGNVTFYLYGYDSIAASNHHVINEVKIPAT